MRISDWSSDVCSSELTGAARNPDGPVTMLYGAAISFEVRAEGGATRLRGAFPYDAETTLGDGRRERFAARAFRHRIEAGENIFLLAGHDAEKPLASRSEEHTSELQSLMRTSYAVFRLKKKNTTNN